MLGTNKHLVQFSMSGPLTWSCNVPKPCMVLGYTSDNPSMDAAFEIFHEVIPEIVPKEFEDAMLACKVSCSEIPWHKIIPSKRYHQLLDNALSRMWELLLKMQETNYLQTYIEIQEFLKCLKPAKIDESILHKYLQIEKSASVLSTLGSFQPSAKGMSPAITYATSKTITGRLIVGSGPRILTLPTAYRNIIKSNFKNGKIIEVDFKSLEPRVALILAGKTPPYDVYEEISTLLFEEKLKRSQVKIAVLCALYGVSERKLSELLSSDFKANEIIRKIKEYFCYDDIVTKLKEAYDEKKYILSALGRPIYCESARENILYSNFVQSTASDVAILGFKSLLDSTAIREKEATPLFLIHDALILDCNPSTDEFIPEFIELENFGKLYLQQSMIV